VSHLRFCPSRSTTAPLRCVFSPIAAVRQPKTWPPARMPIRGQPIRSYADVSIAAAVYPLEFYFLTNKISTFGRCDLSVVTACKR